MHGRSRHAVNQEIGHKHSQNSFSGLPALFSCFPCSKSSTLKLTNWDQLRATALLLYLLLCAKQRCLDPLPDPNL